MSKELDIWLGSRLVAQTMTRDRTKKVRIAYVAEIRDEYSPETPLLSCSLPTPGPSEPAEASAFLEGLLPEGRGLVAAAAQVQGVRLVNGAPETARDVTALLGEYGRECAGAIAVVPQGHRPDFGGRYELLDDNALGALVRNLPQRPLGTDLTRDIRMSLAGAQDKLLLTRIGNRWYEPVGGAASTHIVKPTTTWPHSAHNEAFVLALGRACGLLTNTSWVEQMGDNSVLVVERYDRRIENEQVTRLHQEDMCQAIGLRPKDKYDIGRPSERMARLLREFADSPRTETARLFQQIAFRAVVGDADGHGKNYSLLLDNGRVTLAPLYDSLCTLIYPELSATMGAPVDTQSTLLKVDRAALLAEATAMRLTHSEADESLDQLALTLRTTIDTLESELTRDWPSDRVIETVSARIDRLQTGEPLGGQLTQRSSRSTPVSGRPTLDAATAARHDRK
jgi:serine/threonine-protein kinase HipA